MQVGMEECRQLPTITEALMRKGYSALTCERSSANMLRLLSEVGHVSNKLRGSK